MTHWSENITVSWADCDAAGMVFYPNFYVWFDQATEKMFRKAGFTYGVIQEKFGILGMPLLETGAQYENACRHGDELVLESRAEDFSGKTFTVRHTLTHADGRPALSGFEKRIFAAAAPDRANGIRAVEPPEELIGFFKD